MRCSDLGSRLLGRRLAPPPGQPQPGQPLLRLLRHWFGLSLRSNGPRHRHHWCGRRSRQARRPCHYHQARDVLARESQRLQWCCGHAEANAQVALQGPIRSGRTHCLRNDGHPLVGYDLNNRPTIILFPNAVGLHGGGLRADPNRRESGS
jgi:hypothetical protein